MQNYLKNNKHEDNKFVINRYK